MKKDYTMLIWMGISMVLVLVFALMSNVAIDEQMWNLQAQITDNYYTIKMNTTRLDVVEIAQIRTSSDDIPESDDEENWTRWWTDWILICLVWDIPNVCNIYFDWMHNNVWVIYDNPMWKFMVNYKWAIFDYCLPPVLREDFEVNILDIDNSCWDFRIN